MALTSTSSFITANDGLAIVTDIIILDTGNLRCIRAQVGRSKVNIPGLSIYHLIFPIRLFQGILEN